MFAQIKLMNEFATPFVKTTNLGYCLSTLEVALNHILSYTDKDLIQDGEGDWNEDRRSMSRSLRESVR